jgi:spectinomycin phosphotransferase
LEALDTLAIEEDKFRMRGAPHISPDQLRAICEEHYDLEGATLEFLPVGKDNRTGVYRAVSRQGIPYLLKVRSGPFYEASCLIPHYLRDQGITSVVAPLPTRSNSMWARIGEWTVILYPFIDGYTGWTPPMTTPQWKAVGAALDQIHGVNPPSSVEYPSLRRETFDPAGYRLSVGDIEAQHIQSPGCGRYEQELCSVWLAHESIIHTAVSEMEVLAAVLREHSGPFVACHADLHPGNIIRSQGDQVFLIDWDEVMLAPRERDFLFVGVVPERASGLLEPTVSPFLIGYGQMEIDWAALTYYLWERVVQDLIAFAEEVFRRDDLSEADKADAVMLSRSILSEKGDEVDKARFAAAHLTASQPVQPAEHSG